MMYKSINLNFDISYFMMYNKYYESVKEKANTNLY
jgi:hypothetical protein